MIIRTMIAAIFLSQSVACTVPKKTTSKEYDKWNSFLHAEVRFQENKEYLIARAKGEVWYCTIEEVTRLKNSCLEKGKNGKIEPQQDDPGFYKISCWDKEGVKK